MHEAVGVEPYVQLPCAFDPEIQAATGKFPKILSFPSTEFDEISIAFGASYFGFPAFSLIIFLPSVMK